jgi:hypothetical protein
MDPGVAGATRGGRIMASSVRRWLRWGVLLVSTAAIASPSDEPVADSEAQFQAFALEYLRHPDRLPDAGPGEDAGKIVDGDMQLGLETVWLKCRAAGGTRGACLPVLEAHFRSVLDLVQREDGDGDGSFAAVAPRLRLKLAPDAYLRAGIGDLLAAEFVPGVIRTVVIDAPESMTYVTREQLGSWDVTEATVWAEAERRSSGDSENVPAKSRNRRAEPVLMVALGDGYDAARILLPDVRARAADVLGEPFYAAVPHRDALIMWSRSHDASGGRRLRELIQRDYEQSPYALTPEVLQVTREGVAVLEDADAR